MNPNITKLLLIGATGFNRNKEGLCLECVSWEKLGRIQNIRDFDILVVNLLSLETDNQQSNVDWKHFYDLFDFASTADILGHDGKIVIVGDPRFKVSVNPKKAPVPFLFWTGLEMAWDNQPGNTIKIGNHFFDEFKEYKKRLKSWDYSLARCELDSDALQLQWSFDDLRAKGLTSNADIQAACVNRYNRAIAFQVYHRINDRYGVNQIRFGPIVFLPKIDLAEDETLHLILQDFCDAAASLPEPPWLSTFVVPGQAEVDKKISEYESNIVRETKQLEKALAERIDVRACLKLLYEREFALEPIVRQVLRELGGKIEDPVENNKEDGWLTVTVKSTEHLGVLEIKSTKNDQFGEDGRKQLLDWIDRGRELRSKNYKGIFIGNSAVGKPLDERPDAFSSGWKKNAALSHICAMKSEDLFAIYVLHKKGKVNLDDFWTRLFATDGVFDVTPFLPKPTK